MIDLTRVTSSCWEREYLAEIFSYLPDVEAVAFHNWNKADCIPPRVKPNTVLVMISDEFCNPTPKARCRLFLRQHHAADHGVPIPLGIMAGFPKRPIKPMAERKYDVSFAGRIHPTRSNIAEIAAHRFIRSLKTKFVTNERPDGGKDDRQLLPLSEYADMMYDSKIVLSPRGWRAAECFRWFEGLYCGCAVIHPRMPDNWIYRDTPTFTVEPFEVAAVVEQVQKVLSDPSELQRASDAAVAHWKEVCSPAAVAHRIDCLLRNNQPSASWHRNGRS